MESALNQIEIP